MKLTPEQIQRLHQLKKEYVNAFVKREKNGANQFAVNIECLRDISHVIKELMDTVASNIRDTLDDVSDEIAFTEFLTLFSELKSHVFTDAVVAKTNKTFASEPRITELSYNENRSCNIYSSQTSANYRITFSDGFQINMPSLDPYVLAKAKSMFNDKMLELKPQRRLRQTLNR